MSYSFSVSDPTKSGAKDKAWDAAQANVSNVSIRNGLKDCMNKHIDALSDDGATTVNLSVSGDVVEDTPGHVASATVTMTASLS